MGQATRVKWRSASALRTRLAGLKPSPHFSVGIELVHVSDLAQRPPHRFHDLHVLQRRLQRGGGCRHGLHRCVTGPIGCGSRFLGGQARHLAGFPKVLPFLPSGVERLSILIADLSCFLCQPSELFRLGPLGLGLHAVPFGDFATLLGVLTTALCLIACAFRLLALLFKRFRMVRHAESLIPRSRR
jgi:hypothetical protein